jgi:hypothetical protein
VSAAYFEALFKLGNLIIMPLWLLLFFAPNSRWAEKLFAGRYVLLLLAVLYALAVVPALGSNPQFLTALLNPTMSGVQMLLSSDGGASAGWIHYLCFDLFVALEIRERAKERNHSFWWVSPVFFLVLMLGPLGWLVFELVSYGLTTLVPREAKVRSTIS